MFVNSFEIINLKPIDIPETNYTNIEFLMSIAARHINYRCLIL
jgi:hypothetical protein